MTVAVQDPINQFTIAGGETSGPWTWQLNAEADLTVFKQLASTEAIVPLTLDTDYSVVTAGLGNKLGGTITFLAPQLPAVAGDVWTLQRDTVLKRGKDFATSGDFQAVTVNPQMDDPVLMEQDRKRDVDNALRKNPGVGDVLNPLIPQPVDRRCAIFEETTPGNFDIVMSADDPDGQFGLLTMKGDLLTHNATEALRIGAGTNGYVVVADSGDVNGLLWKQLDTEGIADGAITEVKLSNGSVTNPKIASGAVDSPKLSMNSVSTVKIVDGAVTSGKLDAGTAVTVVAADKVVIKDTSDSDNLKTVTAQSIADLGGGGGGIVLGTPQATTSGNSKTFASIPAGTKQITFILNEVSADSTGNYLIQIGPSGGLETTSYISTSAEIQNSGTTVGAATNGFLIDVGSASYLVSGNMILTLIDSSTNTWISSHSVKLLNSLVTTGGGSKVISGELTQVGIILTAGNFDAGSVNIQYQ